ncbi:MAG: hypothetical protein K0R17_3709 [Rariglobus sp.]|jgi:hypothetical protein|nr:hypothetical protein [Rariglobus sp.]
MHATPGHIAVEDTPAPVAFASVSSPPVHRNPLSMHLIRVIPLLLFPCVLHALTPPALPYRVDRYGQSATKSYPGKVTSDDELRADAGLPLAPLAKSPALDAFGGLAGSGEKFGLKKTGFFHVGSAAGRQVLVTPEGNLFFQLGVCGIASTDDYTLVKGREEIYEWLPPAGEGEFASAWRPGSTGIFSFYIANWIRKYQRPFTFDEWSGQAVDRLRAWGFNSAGAFSVQSTAMRKRGFPYVAMATPNLGMGLKMLPGRIGTTEVMDPFAPGNAETLAAAYTSRHAGKTSADPALIGYFLGNEQHFEHIPKLVPAFGASVPAKLRLVQLLRDKYQSVERFNAAWKPAAPFSTFDALAAAPLMVSTDEAAADVRAYFELFLETYYEMVSSALRRADPNHLLIGSRLTPGTSSNQTVVRISGKYTDVVSINYYTFGIEKEFLERVHTWSGGRPLLLSEWYYATTEQGLNAPNEVASDRERGMAYRNYIEQSAALPFVVGSQWFIYTDQSITGRFFEGFTGEGYNTGLVNVVDRPYPELVRQAAETHARIFDVMLGTVPPFKHEDPRFTGVRTDTRKALTIPRALPGLRIDGTTSNWPGRPAEPLTSQGHALGAINPAFRGDFRLCWDDERLYVFVQVKDATPLLNSKAPPLLWAADGAEIFIGAREIDKPGTMLFSDRQILLGAGTPGKIHIVDHPADGPRCEVIAIKDIDGEGYVLSAGIPWSVLGIDPATTRELIFDIALNNSDDGAQRHQQIVWNGTSQNSGDRRFWGRAHLTNN